MLSSLKGLLVEIRSPCNVARQVRVPISCSFLDIYLSGGALINKQISCRKKWWAIFCADLVLPKEKLRFYLCLFVSLFVHGITQNSAVDFNKYRLIYGNETLHK